MKTIIFDLGKTIIDNIALDFVAGFKSLLQYYQLDRYYDEVIKQHHELKDDVFKPREQSFLEIPFKDYLKFILAPYNIILDLVEAEIIFLKAAEQIGLIKGAKSCLDKLKTSGYRIIALSNSTFSGTALKWQLDQLGLKEYFDEVYSSADWLFCKPSPHLFKQILSIEKTTTNDIVMVGNDLEKDILPAVKLGIKTFWYSKKEQLEFESYKDYDELSEKIKNLG